MIGSQYKQNNSLEKTESEGYKADNTTSWVYSYFNFVRQVENYAHTALGVFIGINFVILRLNNQDYFIDSVEGIYFGSSICTCIKVSAGSIIGGSITLFLGKVVYPFVIQQFLSPNSENDNLPVNNLDVLIDDNMSLDLNNTCPAEYIYN